ncbi:MAG: right-handed parallel beta-helix repeat-containing protein [Bacteroidota bacterium]
MPNNLLSQVSINTDNAAPDQSAMLDIQSNSSGFLVPRMTENERMAIASPSQGLLLFQTDQESRFYYNEGTPSMPEWAKMAIVSSSTNSPCDPRIPIDSVFNGTNYNIDDPGSYYFTRNIFLTGITEAGIRINTPGVTLDLNGYALTSDGISGAGIFISGTYQNVIIKNGSVQGWGGDGIHAGVADESIFRDLVISNNGDDGLIVDKSCLIYNVQSTGNERHGIYADEGGVIVNSNASLNETGIEVLRECVIINCVASENIDDGFKAGECARIDGCSAYDNANFGFDIARSSLITNSTANSNGRTGFDVSSSCILMNNVANNNGQCWSDGSCTASSSNNEGAGIRIGSYAKVLNNTCNDNVMGLVVTGSYSIIEGNSVTDNQHVGIAVKDDRVLVIRNRGENNGFNPIASLVAGGIDPDGNIIIDPTSVYGPIIDVSSTGNLLNNANATHPYANFEY